MNIIFEEEQKLILKRMSEVESKIDKEQARALKLMGEGENIFLTGPSGTGKSLLIKMFRDIYGSRRRIGVTSTTGISAVLLGGSTVHSYLGIGLGKESVDILYKKIKRNPKKLGIWMNLETLIIDEVSMLSPELFDKLEKLGRMFRCGMINKGKPFGGIQVILTGDFLQLPVVGSDRFLFEAESWNEVINGNIIYLQKIHRQEDKEFMSMLNELRYGLVTDKTKKLLEGRKDIELKEIDGIKPTRMFTTNSYVDAINEEELNSLESDEICQYDMEIHFTKFVKNMSDVVTKFKNQCIAPETLYLSIGAQVMLLRNLNVEEGLANGSRGVVVSFIDGFPLVKFLNGMEIVVDTQVWEIFDGDVHIANIKQIPLRLAWAVTVHKSQGCTLDYATIDLSNVFEHGQAYVAISRVRTLEGLKIENINYECIKAHPKAVKFYKNLQSK